MFNTREKKERSLGVKLMLKPHRCASPKCVATRNPNKPGPHGLAFRRTLSEFGSQLKEKQKIAATYGMRDRSMKRLFAMAARNPAATGQTFLTLLERRLDNVVYRLGFAPSRSVARILVGHGHMFVNGKRTDIPSALLKIGDRVTVRPQSRDNALCKNISEAIKTYDAPIWLKLDKEKLEGTVASLPKDFDAPFDINMVVDYYSK